MSRYWPLYNPALLPPELLTLPCSLRRPLAERLLKSLERLGTEGAPQHRLLLGGPGSGKTTFLGMLRNAIAQEPELSSRWLPLTFAEAQWDVARPCDLWVNALDYLVITLERAGAQGLADSIRARSAALPADDHERNGASLALLNHASEELGRRFVLLVDTLDIVLDRLKRDQWHVREVLSAEPRLLVIGASARAIEATYRYDAVFFDFFQIHELRPLPREGLVSLLAAMHPDDPLSRVAAFAQSSPAVLEALLDLFGTQPRVLALIGVVLAQVPDPGPAELALAVLDLMTPAMLARIEQLAPQTQQVVHALACAWEPVRPSDLAQRTRLTANTVSAQLHRLVQDGIAEKIPLPAGARHGFVLADPLLQLWLLMRMGQPHRGRLSERVERLVAERRNV